MTDLSPLVIAIGTVLAAAVSAFVVWWVALREQPTKDTDVFVQSAIALVKPLRQDLAVLRKEQGVQSERIKLLEDENRLLASWARALTAQLQEAKIDPITLAEIRNWST